MRTALIAAVAAATLAACTPSPPRIRAEEASVVATPSGAAAYFVLANDGGKDRLAGVSAPGTGTASLHRSEMEDGIARMRPVRRVDIPRGGEVVFEPGGYHVMIDHLKRPLEPGSTVVLELHLKRQGDLRVEAPVRSAANTHAMAGM